MKQQHRSDRVKQFWDNSPKTIHHQMGLYYLFGDPETDELIRQASLEVLSYLPPLQGMTILDLPSGLGRFTSVFAAQAKQVVAVDLAPSQIEQNKIRNASFSNIEYLCKDAMDLSFQPAKFDLIFMSWLFTYLEDAEIETLVPRLESWIKPGGYLFFIESCRARHTRNESRGDGYFAIYRGFKEYPRFFQGKFTLVQEGNLLSYEHLLADPFKGFWLYQLT